MGDKSTIYGLLLASLLLVRPGDVLAQRVGQVVSAEGIAEVQRTGVTGWQRLTVPTEVWWRDQLRTQTAAKVKILFQDDSVLTLGENTLLTVDEQVTPPAAAGTSIFTLLQGLLQAVVSDRYQLPGARFEVRTPTAVSGVRGTGFIISCQAGSCLFLCLFGRVQVTASAFPHLPIFLDRQFFTEVQPNQPPTSPQVMPDAQVQDLLEQTTAVGTGAQQDRLGADGAVTHSGVPLEDQPQPGPGGPPPPVPGQGAESGQPTRVDQPLFEAGSDRVPILPLDLPPLQKPPPEPPPLPVQTPLINIPPIQLPPLDIVPPTRR